MDKLISLFWFCIFCSTTFLCAQEKLNTFYVNPFIGIRGQSNELAEIRGPIREIHPFFMVGVEFGKKNFPLSLSATKEWNLTFRVYNNVNSLQKNTIKGTWTENHYLLKYQLNSLNKIGLGYFFMMRENLGHHISPVGLERKNQGLLLGFSRQVDWLQIEYRSKILLDPNFSAIVGLYPHSINLSFALGSKKAYPDQPKFNRYFDLKPLIGVRFFPLKGMTILKGETFPAIGSAAILGLELLQKSSCFSINYENDFWIAFNGGSQNRDIKGLISANFIGLRRHFEMKNGRHLRLGLGYSYIIDFNKKMLLTLPTDLNYKGLLRFQVKGIAGTASYELLKRTDVELKHTFPVRSLNEPLFNPIRFSVGLVRRVNM